MKQTFTLLIAALFTAFSANAQISENFDDYGALVSNCWQLTSTRSITGTLAINTTPSIGTIATENTEIKTPYLDIAGTCNVSFTYMLSSNLNNNAERLIEIGTTDKNGTFVAATSFTLTKNTKEKKAFTFNQDLAFSAGTKRVTIRVTPSSGDGNSSVFFDDLAISSATYHYSGSHCNTPPVANDTTYNTFGTAVFTGNLSTKASDADAGESIAFAADTLSANTGTLVLNADGSFAFTPYGSFTGGLVTFTYHVTDNGYESLSSNIATVTIRYPNQITLPVYVSSFSGNLVNNKAQLSWAVTQNEDGDYFQLEKSADGKTFTVAAIVMNTGKAGAEAYNYTDAKFNGTAYYRLKVINKSAAVAYSKTIVLQAAAVAKASNLTLLQNPVTSAINFTYQANANGAGVINLYTAAGVKVYTTQINLRSGLNQSTVGISSQMAPGAYLLEVVNGSERSLAKVVKY